VGEVEEEEVVVDEDTEEVVVVDTVVDMADQAPILTEDCANHTKDFCNLPGQYPLSFVSPCFVSFRSSTVFAHYKVEHHVAHLHRVVVPL
jgi:hypothetical protein